MNILKFFDKKTETKQEFDNTYFLELCAKKRSIENSINIAKCPDLQELLEKNLRTIDAEINYIVIQEKKARGQEYSKPKPEKRTVPIFINGEVI